MMPGDSRSNTVVIAADTAFGKCPKCSALHQSLKEYATSFLALKQKIVVSDDSIRLQQQLEELQIRLASLEKKTADYESLQEELEEKKDALKAYGSMSEVMEKLKQENSKTMAEKNKLEGQLKEANDLTETQTLENAQLKREKVMVENELLKTQTSLNKSQAQADQVEKLIEQNAKMSSIKDNLENKVRLLEDSVCKKDYQISHLTKDKILLEGNIDDLQARLLRLERERNKEYRSSSTQASAPKEPKVDKEKVRMLLENLWECVELPQPHVASLLHLPESHSKQDVPFSPKKRLSSTSQSASHKISHPMQTKALCTQLKTSSDLTAIKDQAHLPSRSVTKEKETPKKSKPLSKEHKTERSPPDLISPEVSFEEILAMFQPLLPCISPLPDLETEMVSMETDNGEKESCSKLSDDSVSLQQEESLLGTTLVTSQCPKSSAVPTEAIVDFSVITTQEVDRVSSGNHFKESGQNELRDITEINKNSEAGEEMHLEKDLQQESAVVQLVSASSSSTSDITVEVASFACVENVLGKTKEDESELVTNIDVNGSLSDDSGTKTNTPDGESPRRNDLTVTSEKARDAKLITSSAFHSVRDAEITNTQNCPEVGEINQNTCGLRRGSRDVVGFKPQEKKGCVGEIMDLPKDNPCLSLNNVSSVSNENIKAGIKNDESKPVGKEDVNEAQETAAVDVKTFHSQSACDNSPPSPHKSPLLKIEDDGSHADQESEQANVGIENLNCGHGPSPSDSQEPNTLHCSSLNENKHSLCRRLSPTCIFPTIKLKALETDPNPTKCNVCSNVELISTDKSPQLLPNLDAEFFSKKDVVQLSKFGTFSPTASLEQNGAVTNGQKTCLESQTNWPEKQSPHTSREEEPGSMEGSCTAQPEYMGHVLSEMGPPLPRMLTPLSTPPKVGKSINPRQAIGKLSFPSPMDMLASPAAPIQDPLTPNSQQQCSSSLDSPVLLNGVPSSPLQFGSATPEHAVPVPGRLPSAAMISSPLLSSSSSQENSMRILDTMYPELSAHARTLSILKGNVGLSICSSESGTLPAKSTSQMSGFKAINPMSTAFTKTEMKGEKRPSNSFPESRNGKCPRPDNCSPTASRKRVPSSSSSNGGEESAAPQTLSLKQLTNESTSPSTDTGEPADQNLIVNALTKIENQCFDLLPVIQSHLYVGNLPKKPVLRSEEKEVISEVCQSGLFKADDMVFAILNKLKAEKSELSSNCMQALCRVHTGICRQRGDWEKALTLAYSILTEDFPDAAKLILFMVTTWPNVLSNGSSLCQAIHAVTKLKANENLLSCLTAFLGWEKSPPCDIDKLISTTLSNIRSGSSLSFTKHSRHGDDLGSEAWEYVLTLNLLCSHKKWKWTYENVLGKDLWPLMNTWMTQPRDQKAPISDVTVAAVLRLIGLLGQLGIKERCVSNVVTIANVINTFGRHGPNEGVPWVVQLAAIYSIYDLSPCNPKQALDALAGWRGDTTECVPPAVTSCIYQLASVCRQVKS